MSWQAELDELKRREAFAEKLGGEMRVQRQKDGGRYTVRERIELLADDGSFHEIGKIAGMAEYNGKNDLEDFVPSNFVFGRARLNGRQVVIAGDDFTVRGGSADATIKEKHLNAEAMANALQLPLVRLVEGSGGGGSVKTIETTGRANVPGVAGWDMVVANIGTVPRVALGLGSVAGLGAAHLAASHYSVMLKDKSAMFVAGPPVVERIGQKLTKNELGGFKIQLRAGAVDHAVNTEEEAFECARQFLSYLPQSVNELPPRVDPEDDPNRRVDWLIDAIPRDIRKIYKMRPIVKALVDEGSFFEMGKEYGKSVITGLARLDGWPVALMASDPMSYGGCWTADTCRKVEKFVDLAETFHLPIVNLSDCPGFQVGLEAEQSGVIKEGVRVMSAIWQTTVPWCTMIIRNVFGVAGAAHTVGGRYTTRYAWPSGRWGSLPLEGGIEAAYSADIAAAEDPDAELATITDRLEKLRSPFRSAETFWIEEIIDPRETRGLLCDFANMAAPLRTTGASSHAMRP
ncbi:MAG: methylmalonyl-CoA carboxyltransferase [Rhodospirillaceae bacterium]|jgi:acetyl-CoA carboxylase carboxyltransferase component|nr:methylmalonyl-CoA carboxyltransferase [Rhodospirillaceae bacterium]MBT3494538.1 methylmalonyl-CoA carboxyltransferase [Rhodospirillaceae bacterium]MBT3778394.1 methylmalonyl-CoA carboxyltransferase [Rhodospirillaceae bacterium]MBT3974844.1 methylmalonyl-CoA carboxyltransferase [Rhodospirillaceae bacterium]MBT4169161.1 methylmalonyl-CoA carboxyltransferase [Rhodospirillaceae bacterium]